ncbi:MAG: hypothetical protein KAI64_02375 [Thermoplasmata archaeon]|nr:hypothetical protein [Thermoplasmata archaeon]
MSARRNQDVELFQSDYAIMYVTVFDRLNARVQLSTGTMTYLYHVTRHQRNPTPLFTKTLGAGISIAPDQTGSTRGLMYVEIDPADTAAFEGKLYHECKITDLGGVPASRPRVVLTGDFTVLVSTTQ